MDGFREWTGPQIDALPHLAPGWERSEPEPPRVNFKPLDVFLAEFEPPAYVLEPLFRTGSLYTLTARTGAGKTAFMISAALAVTTGRQDILNLEPLRGRVAFLTFENPDDVRMRLKISAYLLNVDVRQIADQLLILDMRASPEAVLASLTALAQIEPFVLVFVDTLAAMFDGDDANNPVQAGNFLRRLRPMTKVAGSPSVIVGSHPVKNAQQDQLIPYGSGAILNEVDGNFTLWRRNETGTIELHWQGKLRGIEFPPANFRFEQACSPDVVDSKGRKVALPVMVPAKLEEADEEAKVEADADTNIALLKAMMAEPRGTFRQWADDIGRTKSTVERTLQSLSRDKLAEKLAGRWRITSRGEKEVEKWG